MREFGSYKIYCACVAFVFCGAAFAVEPCEEILTSQAALPRAGFFAEHADDSAELLAKIKEAYSNLLRVHGAGIVSIEDLKSLLKTGREDVTSGSKSIMGYFLLSQEGSSERAQLADGLRRLILTLPASPTF